MTWFDSLFGKTVSKQIQIEHPEFGTLTYNPDGWWDGKTQAAGFDLELSIDGDENGLGEGLDEICGDVLNRFPQYHARALIKLDQTVSEYKIPIALEFTPFEILWIWKDSQKDGFAIRFNDNDDEYKLWRVEFENGEPIGCGYDD
jgi:hypothetical protein